MFQFTMPYYYGEGSDHIVRLTSEEANAVNKIRIFGLVEGENGDMYVKTNLNDAEMEAYNSAATVLNEYVETHQVLASETFLENNEMLRPVV